MPGASLKRMLSRLLRDCKAVVGIEMAFLAPPFLLLLVTVIDLGLMVTTQSVLDGTARDAMLMPTMPGD